MRGLSAPTSHRAGLVGARRRPYLAGVRVAFACLLILLAAAAPAAARSGPVQFGTALNTGGFASGDGADLSAVARPDAVTAETAMKMHDLQPARGRFEFAFADRMVAWARERGKLVHGHTLVWCADET